MQIGFIGLGRMGLNMVYRLAEGGHDVHVWNRSPQKVKDAQNKGAKGYTTVEEMVSALDSPKVVWMMLP